MRDDFGLPNTEYWNQLCGSRAARKLGIVAEDPAGVGTFDSWFFDFYPYLRDDRFIPWSSLTGRTVLEIGLGYGSVSRRLSTSGAYVTGVDISPGPLYFARATSQAVGAVRASALRLPFADCSVDFIVSIGCLHHTGNLDQSIHECLRVLQPGGSLTMMVYNRYSYKKWIVSPRATLSAWISERRGTSSEGGNQARPRVSRFWDRNLDGEAPPFTEFVSKRHLLNQFAAASRVEVTTINVDNLTDLLPARLQRLRFDLVRTRLLDTWLSQKMGLDLYVKVVK